MKQQTASQTVGPFFKVGMTYSELNNLVNEKTVGERIWVRGRVYDGDGNAVPDATIELWQADANGVYNGDFFGFGRAPTDDNGNYWFRTIKPGVVDDMPPHLNVRVFMRGMLLHAVTRLYFGDEDNSADATLSSVPADRRHTLIAQRDDGEGTPTYRLDFHMQGENETVFFEP